MTSHFERRDIDSFSPLEFWIQYAAKNYLKVYLQWLNIYAKKWHSSLEKLREISLGSERAFTCWAWSSPFTLSRRNEEKLYFNQLIVSLLNIKSLTTSPVYHYLLLLSYSAEDVEPKRSKSSLCDLRSLEASNAFKQLNHYDYSVQVMMVVCFHSSERGHWERMWAESTPTITFLIVKRCFAE